MHTNIFSVLVLWIIFAVLSEGNDCQINPSIRIIWKNLKKIHIQDPISHLNQNFHGHNTSLC